MSDIKLFKLFNGEACELEGQASDLEKPLQTLIENNLDSMLGIRFLSTEHHTGKTHAGRIDSLGLDENHSPVILEYKRSVGENVINQGLFYLDWLMDHQAEFKLLVMEKLGHDAAALIDWSEPRLLCIAADFTKYDAHAVQQINRNVELIRYRRFGPDLLLLELVNTASTTKPKAGRAEKAIPTTPATPKTKATNGDKTYAQWQEQLSAPMQELLTSLEDFIGSLGDDVQRKELKLYVAFKRLKNFASIVPQKSRLLLFLHLNPDTLAPLPANARDARLFGHWGTGDLELSIANFADLEHVKPLILAAYEGRSQIAHRQHRARQHTRRPQVSRRQHPQDLRLRRRQSTFFRQAVEHRLQPARRPLGTLSILRRTARQAGRLCLPAAHRPLPQPHRARRVHPAAWRALSRQCRSRYPPTGRVRIAAPLRMKMDTVRVYALSKLPWIKAQRRKLQSQERETPREFLERESHYLWGRRYLLTLTEGDGPSRVELRHRHMVLNTAHGTSRESKEAVVAQWYRAQLKLTVAKMLPRWEAVLGVSVDRVFVQQMKTRWGSCNPASRSIRLNSDLAKKPPECLEYVLVHELIHLLEPTHNARFQFLMEQFMPQWQVHRAALNELPVRHEDWAY